MIFAFLYFGVSLFVFAGQKASAPGTIPGVRHQTP